VIADECHEWIIKTLENVARPLELVIRSGISQVTTVNHEVDVTAIVQVGHLIFGISKPQVGIADEGHAKGLLIGKLRLDHFHLSRIDVLLTMDIHVVRMDVEHTTARRK